MFSLARKQGIHYRYGHFDMYLFFTRLVVSLIDLEDNMLAPAQDVDAFTLLLHRNELFLACGTKLLPESSQIVNGKSADVHGFSRGP